MQRLRVIYQRFTSCCGCQLTLLNCEAELAEVVERVDFVEFVMASSTHDDGGVVDLALIEGSISDPQALEKLLAVRRRSRFLAAVGACALSGGVNRLAGSRTRDALTRVYGAAAENMTYFPPQPVGNFVEVDLRIAGCPPEKKELVWTLGALARHGLPALPAYAVCMECRMQENRCLLIEDAMPCLGPVTRAGCGARCPSFGVICEGCRGEVDECNREEEFRLLREIGLPEKEIRARLSRFGSAGHEDDSR